MAIVFPSSPSLDQKFIAGAREWVWAGFAWRKSTLQYAILDGGSAATEFFANFDIADGGDA
jgi:hypothetical protein